jgi:hypothetical protein
MQSVPITTNVVWFEPHSWRGAIDTTLCDKVCQCLVASRLFSPGTLVSTTIKTDRHDIAEIRIFFSGFAAFTETLCLYNYNN